MMMWFLNNCNVYMSNFSCKHCVQLLFHLLFQEGCKERYILYLASIAWPTCIWATSCYSARINNKPKAVVQSKMLWQMHNLKIYKYVSNTWPFKCKSNIQSFGFSCFIHKNSSFFKSPYQTETQIVECSTFWNIPELSNVIIPVHDACWN